MPSVIIQAPPDVVFEAMCDLTRHPKWAKHDIVIEAGQEGLPAVGNAYSSSEKGATPDQLTVTELVPNELLKFHSHMSRGMGWDFDFTMTARPEGDGTMVTRDAKITKLIDFLEKTGIEYLNSAELLAQAQELYPGKCFTNYCAVGHFNELGHEVFAGILADVIKEGHASWR